MLASRFVLLWYATKIFSNRVRFQKIDLHITKKTNRSFLHKQKNSVYYEEASYIVKPLSLSPLFDKRGLGGD